MPATPQGPALAKDMPMRRKIAAGNWKMNGTTASAAVLADLAAAHPAPSAEVVICPPAPLIGALAALGTPFHIGGQDCHAATSGAHTGDTSATLLKDVGATHVIVGHSERRADHAESDADIRAKAQAAIDAGLTAIICVGETEAERDAGTALSVIGAQLDGSIPDTATAATTVIAYEPVWAIGTGRTPSTDDIAAVHADIRARLAARFGTETAQAMRVLYGGSVKPGNAAEIFAIPNVDGGLVGGASLSAKDFGPIIAAAG